MVEILSVTSSSLAEEYYRVQESWCYFTRIYYARIMNLTIKEPLVAIGCLLVVLGLDL